VAHFCWWLTPPVLLPTGSCGNEKVLTPDTGPRALNLANVSASAWLATPPQVFHQTPPRNCRCPRLSTNRIYIRRSGPRGAIHFTQSAGTATSRSSFIFNICARPTVPLCTKSSFFSTHFGIIPMERFRRKCQYTGSGILLRLFDFLFMGVPQQGLKVFPVRGYCLPGWLTHLSTVVRSAICFSCGFLPALIPPPFLNSFPRSEQSLT